MWQPITRNELATLIAESESQMDADQLRFWKSIAMTPQKWQQSPMGDQGGGFWVVGKTDNTCIYYNDIEDGFNAASYQKTGVIDHYLCEQDELHWLIHKLRHSAG